MHVPRRFPALIVVASLAGAAFGAPGSALAQSAGDDQYQDPLAGETQTQTVPTPAPTKTTTPTTPVPQLSPTTTPSSSGTSAGTTAGTTTAPAPTVAPTQSGATALASTGVDGRILAGMGIGLLLCGLGLRLRTARERF